ncbi:enoyl-ACP reductase FabI [Buchnera aphidicola]|uniref:Enoyl-[acyl-carrier-protein] reductase [NADH] FabI n=1 Tax=Buchnera aphidicola subsp. Baizongia pistaciae (strain Bp) TaxID=224915 RepID=FABI_BUCBP|nr:enoyl-ACP reductase [Buchnera aphidicola]Q89AM1.1 RecName: Full=Enoyl-[acyl-carrier-protein] reductase [NADH] FabI; Short=ENR; AltName: Full=NADH-dependent enoyl-ACP reductase [Buchnera aphidicola str. Bp (Baizongia pistaciae)]
MGFLEEKKILVTGISNKYSIAFGIAKALHKQNATLAFSYHTDRLKNKVYELAKELGVKIVIPCDVSDDNSIKRLFFNISKKWITFDGFIHSIAFAPKNQLSGDYVSSITRLDFSNVLDVSSYSFVGMAKACRSILKKGSSLLTLSYIGSKKVVPNYNVMGIAKASLESNVRYMASCMGLNGIRVNAISSSPIKTLSSYHIKNFKKILNHTTSRSLNNNLTTVEDVGNTAAFLCSDLSKGITGQIIYVDGGFNITAMSNSE